MGETIATHNGSKARRDHNIRNPKVVDREKHIQPNGHYQIWHDEKPRDAYRRIFGDAVERYNEKQKREDRKINDYYTTICKDKKKHPVYEMIVGVYSDKSGYLLDEDMQKDILKEFWDGWNERNPNLECIGAYFHADEEGEPHVHIDYVPVAHGYTRGMDTQNGLVKALGEMGFIKHGRATAQIQWEARENKALEEICKDYGLTIEHPREEGRKHLETEQFKAEKKLEHTLDNTKDLLDQGDQLRGEVRNLQEQREIANQQMERALKRKEKAFKRSFRRDRENNGYTYDKELEKEIRDVVRDIKDERKALEEHSDLDVEREYQKLTERQEEVERLYREAKDYRDKQKSYILETAEELAKELKNERLERLEAYCKTITVGDKTIFQNFQERENLLREQRIKEMQRSRGPER